MSSQAQLRSGVKGGANLANVSGDLSHENIYHNKVGLHVGAMLDVILNMDFLSLQPEVAFSQKGYIYNDQKVTTYGVTSRYEGTRRYRPWLKVWYRS